MVAFLIPTVAVDTRPINDVTVGGSVSMSSQWKMRVIGYTIRADGSIIETIIFFPEEQYKDSKLWLNDPKTGEKVYEWKPPVKAEPTQVILEFQHSKDNGTTWLPNNVDENDFKQNTTADDTIDTLIVTKHSEGSDYSNGQINVGQKQIYV
ncbi:hypothetical protein CONPUDRAFT_163728 [Coniophora puteana RWD-64-598 SS2]|uniref:Uncharacterized protein n=1 Tax=Coniophora puteana (strain RWD-64-598) TaxID=741705 RepID=A0A5M3MTX1_CONPW|nr:uncharacterized protein CONPUDRAFT_163728 [Coniophora puteana RWD-64-598 SS2]EIW82602.1 hypothetical protein CONPUDRAFT_163728 [Coniophora puteana RWD-64-598 SS2]